MFYNILEGGEQFFFIIVHTMTSVYIKPAMLVNTRVGVCSNTTDVWPRPWLAKHAYICISHG